MKLGGSYICFCWLSLAICIVELLISTTNYVTTVGVHTPMVHVLPHPRIRPWSHAAPHAADSNHLC
jgi:hypothetical protein